MNQWITDFKRRIDGDDDEDGDNINSHSIPNRRANQDPSRYNVVQPQRRSGDRERYDSDPRVLDDNFTELQLRDDEGRAYLLLSWSALANEDSASKIPTATSCKPEPFQSDAATASVWCR